MAKFLNPYTTVIKETSGGEITINLNLTIKLEGDQLSISAETAEPRDEWKPPKMSPVKRQEVDEDDLDMLIPDFDSGEVIEFGRKVE